MPPSDAAARYEEYSKKEVSFIETELKDWFLQRRFSMERNMAIKKALDSNNFTGLSMRNSDVPEAQQVMWADLVKGKPELEDALSANAKAMKVDMYSKMFKDATDLDHPCRVQGSEYLRCLQDNFKDSTKARQMKCMPMFSTFDACRKGLLQQQAKSLEESLVKQDIADKRAKALFERRSILLDTLNH
eukprot:TRINITY_DN4038_c0_g2_i1.p1 TRINITY_DN4038_c0_g2~~TRINITY_DN4038_c0_g2_i1.p1  ORF type:complete len:188 (-),score=79.03 TRINITY_DN4038_c0_g2_i1:114-677(-)